MVSFTGHGGSEPVISSMSPALESTAEEEEGSVSAAPHMSAENIDSSGLVAGQQKAVKQRQLPSIIPGRAEIFMSEKQYEAIVNRRARRARAKAGISRPNVKMQSRRRRGSRGCLPLAKGKQGGTNAGFSQAPSSIPPEDFYGPFVATNEDEEHVGEDAFSSIMNLKSPDFTTILRIMMGGKYHTDVSEEFKSVACLESPDFTTLLTVMNNASFDEAVDDGYYWVDKVKLKLSGWI